jgi:hypothetical protein
VKVLKWIGIALLFLLCGFFLIKFLLWIWDKIKSGEAADAYETASMKVASLAASEPTSLGAAGALAIIGGAKGTLDVAINTVAPAVGTLASGILLAMITANNPNPTEGQTYMIPGYPGQYEYESGAWYEVS